MDDYGLEIVLRETPDKPTLEMLAAMLNRETAHRAILNMYFEVNADGDGIAVHLYVKEQYCLLNTAASIVGNTIELRLPSGSVMAVNREGLDKTSPAWNN